MNRQYGALNGLAIFLVVLNHAIHFGLQVCPVVGTWWRVLVVLQALGNFAVPTFLFVSGAFMAYAAPEYSPGFVRNTLGRLLWPYLVWSGIFYTLIYVASDVSYSATGYLKNLVVGYPYNFIPLLVFWYLVAPAVIFLGRRRGLWLVGAIGIWQTWLLLVRFPAMFGLKGWLPIWAEATAPPVIFTTMSDWGIYFPLGLVLSLQGGTLKSHLHQWRKATASATMVLFAIGLLNAFGIASAPWARFAAPVPLMFLLPTIDRRSIPFVELFEWLGRRSYGIYLTHFVVINGLVLVHGLSAPSLVGLPILVFPAFLLATLGLSLLLMEGLGQTTAGRRAYRHLFGIAPPPLRRT